MHIAAVLKQSWYSKNLATIGLHLLGWVVWFSIPYFRFLNFMNPPVAMENDAPPPLAMEPVFMEKLLSINLLDSFLLVGIFYLNILYLIPKFLKPKGVPAYLRVLFPVTLFYLLGVIIIHFIVIKSWLFPAPVIINSFGGLLFILLLGVTYGLLVERLAAEKIAKEKENEKLKMELGFLRSQISPHFIFNVLNNIVSLSRLQPAMVEPTLMKLSGIMRYMLYEMKHDKVTLQKEIEYLNDYIDLQLQRFQETIKVKKNFTQVNTALKIEPLLLIPFVENAFKHGQVTDGEGCLQLNMKTKGNVLHFEVINRVNEMESEGPAEPGGIGLHNVERRLKLLYDNRFDLQMRKDGDKFITQLEIELI